MNIEFCCCRISSQTLSWDARSTCWEMEVKFQKTMKELHLELWSTSPPLFYYIHTLPTPAERECAGASESPSARHCKEGALPATRLVCLRPAGQARPEMQVKLTLWPEPECLGWSGGADTQAGLPVAVLRPRSFFGKPVFAARPPADQMEFLPPPNTHIHHGGRPALLRVY